MQICYQCLVCFLPDGIVLCLSEAKPDIAAAGGAEIHRYFLPLPSDGEKERGGERWGEEI